RTVVAAAAAQRHMQGCRTPSERRMRQPAHHRIAHDSLAAAAAAPPVRLDDPTRQLGTVGLDALTHDLQTELIEATERGQVRAVEGSVAHGRGLSAGWRREPPSWKTSATLPCDVVNSRRRRAYTLICEEPPFPQGFL